MFLRLKYPLLPQNVELVNHLLDGELSVLLVVPGPHVHSAIRHLLLTNHCNKYRDAS